MVLSDDDLREDSPVRQYERDVAKANEFIEDAKRLIAESKKLLRGKDVLKIKEELEDVVLLQTEESEIDDEANKLADAISSVKLSQVSKLSKFSKGENFSRYCDRFLEYIKISRMRDRDLYLYFLQNMDDETYTILKTAKLTPEEKADGKLFVEIYKRII